MTPAMDGRRFDGEWAERVRLADGGSAELRLMRPRDEALLRAGFEALSEQSRYRRFLAPKPRLTESELRYFTEVDGERHFALGASRIRHGREEGLGVARFVRLPDRPEVAEPAIAVVDSAQGLGLGTALMARLFAAARERGVRAFEFYALDENAPLEGLVAQLPPEALAQLPGGVRRIDLTRLPPGWGGDAA
jgi:GNAT superfamily N-acetyltransferase